MPLLPVSTGTNDVFPVVREATIAGLAAGLVATGAVPRAEALARAKVLEFRAGDRARRRWWTSRCRRRPTSRPAPCGIRRR